jgi:hypothetical protein
MPSHNDWATTQIRVVTLLHGSVESIHVYMHDLAGAAASLCLEIIVAHVYTAPHRACAARGSE